MSTNFDAIVILRIYTQSGPILKLDFGRMVCNTYVFINSNFLSHKTGNRTKKSLTQPSYYGFE